MHQCPYCRSAGRQVKSGFNRTGSQRLQCRTCRRQHTPAPLPLGYDDKTREAALKLYLEGNGFRRIGGLLSVNHQLAAPNLDAPERAFGCLSRGHLPLRR